MCIGLWTLEHPEYALILCTNRDEYLDRPTQDAHFHSFQDHQGPSEVPANILSGRDIKAGGSWFGLNRAGRVALLTNITEPPKSFASSRGYLVSSFLLSDASQPLEEEANKIAPQDAEFAGFNLLLLAPAPHSSFSTLKETHNAEGQGRELDPEQEEACVSSPKRKLTYDAMFVTNHGAGGPLEARRLIAAEIVCGCMSNGVDGQGGNDWPKVKKAACDFNEVMNTLPVDDSSYLKEKQLIEKLFHVLTWQSPEPITQRSQLRNTIQVSPIPLVLNPSGAAIHGTPNPDTPLEATTTATPSTVPPVAISEQPGALLGATVASGSEPYYGTRLSTVLLIRRDGSVLFIERDIWKLDKNGKPERLDHNESRAEGAVKERVFEFNLDWS